MEQSIEIKNEILEHAYSMTEDSRFQTIINHGLFNRESIVIYLNEDKDILIVLDDEGEVRRFVLLAMWGNEVNTEKLELMFISLPSDKDFVGSISSNCFASFVFGPEVIAQIQHSFTSVYPAYSFEEDEDGRSMIVKE